MAPALSGRLILHEPAGVHDVKFRVDLPPVLHGHGPFFRQFLCGQIQGLEQIRCVGEDRATAVQATEAAVDALDGVGGVHDLSDSLSVIVN